MKPIRAWKVWAGLGSVESPATILNRPAHHARINGYALRLVGFVSLLALGLPLGGNAAPSQKLSAGHVPAAVAGLVPAGSLPGTQRLNLAIGLHLRNEQELDALLQQLYDPASPNYHRYLTPEEFNARFGPTEHDYQALMDFAQSNGLAVTATYPNRVVLDVSGTLTDIERTFHVTLRTYRHPREPREFYAPDVEPSVDFAIPILHISGLDNYSLPHPNSKIQSALTSSIDTPNSGSGPINPSTGQPSYWGKDFRSAYVPGTTLTGAGQSVGLLQFDGFYTNDIAIYASKAGLTNVPLTVVPINGGVPTPGTNNGEVCLDIEMAISMAPGLDRVYVFEAPYGSPLESLLSTMITYTNIIHQFSSSWSGGSPNPNAEQIFKQMGAQGQSFFNASGDYDAYTGAIPYPSDSPNITVVGGTTLTTGTGASYSSETVWNWRTVNPNGGNWGSSGGISTYYPIPFYQTNTSMSANQGSTTKRKVPDVALTADNVYVVFSNRVTGIFGGTSCAAPLWAGFTALVNQQAVRIGGPTNTVGFLNPTLYTIGNGLAYASCFNDITNGNNAWSGSFGLFVATNGYDLCTGWGTPKGANLIHMLTVPAPWIISQPQSQTVTAGDNVGFSVIAGGRALLSYQWFFKGRPISTATNYSYSIARVQLSQAGRYTAVATNAYGSVTSAPATLVVNLPQPPTITIQPQSQTVAAGANVTFSVIARGTAPLNYQWYFNSQPISTATGSSYSIAGVQLSQAGKYTVMVSNPYGSVSSAPATLVVASGSAFGVIGAPFNYQIVANNNPTWYSASGLPSGLSCDGTTGLISGTPTKPGTFAVHVQARSIFGSATATILFTIANGAITSATSAQGVIGVPFSYQIVANNSPTAYSASGLPPGLNYDVSSGLISGTPTRTGTFQATVGARNIFGSASTNISLTISNGTIGAASQPRLTVLRTGISNGTIGAASQPTLTVLRTGNSLLLTWPVTSDGFVLEETQVQPSGWTNSSAPVVVQGNQNVATIATTGTAKFYRLRK